MIESKSAGNAIGRQTLKSVMEPGKPLVLPVAHDALSARLIENAGFKAFAVSGSAMLAARYALPDLGIGSLGEMTAGIQDIALSTTAPFVADGDDGHGDVKSAVRMVQLYEAAGVGCVVLEDQARAGKRPGDSQAVALVDEIEFELKLKAMIASRSSENFLIVARTDALAVLGLDGALKRAEAYLSAGADGIFIAGLKAEHELVRAGAEFRGRHQVVVVTEESSAGLPTAAGLFGMGFDFIVFPSYLMLRVTSAITSALQDLMTATQAGEPIRRLPGLEAARGDFQRAVHLSSWQRFE